MELRLLPITRSASLCLTAEWHAYLLNCLEPDDE